MCTVSHPLPPHAHPALTIQLTAPHSVSMHKKLNSINTTMVFLPGDHTLDTNIAVANVARLTMRGESTLSNILAIVCNGPVGLSFTCMVEFKILSLAFTSCGRKHAITKPYIPDQPDFFCCLCGL